MDVIARPARRRTRHRDNPRLKTKRPAPGLRGRQRRGGPAVPSLFRLPHPVNGIRNPCTWLTVTAAVLPAFMSPDHHAARRQHYSTQGWFAHGERPARGTRADSEQARLTTSRVPAAADSHGSSSLLKGDHCYAINDFGARVREGPARIR
jgi:hypothetical protein